MHVIAYREVDSGVGGTGGGLIVRCCGSASLVEDNNSLPGKAAIQ